MRQILNLIERYWIALTALILTAITVLSLSPLPELPSVPGTDKTHHFIAYAILMLPTALRRPQNWLLIAFGFVAYSGAIELIQPYVNRYGEWLDLLANTGGLICGWLIAELINLIPLPAAS